jgi:hypothetical protein
MINLLPVPLSPASWRSMTRFLATWVTHAAMG